MILILLKISGFLVSVTNGLNLLSKKVDILSSVCLYPSHYILMNTAYRRLLKASPQEIRNQRYTNGVTIFPLQKYFKS